MDAVQFDASEEVVVGGSASGAIKLWVLQEAKGPHVLEIIQI